MTYRCKAVLSALFVLGLSLTSTQLFAADPYYDRAQVEFRSKNYGATIVFLRKYLRRFPRDYNTWTFLGASYYHAGQPERALKNLRRVERQVTQKSYNDYYQGLTYLLLNRPASGRRFLAAAAKSQDEYAERATFELALLEYQAEDEEAATYWVAVYLKRFSTGVFKAEAQRMARSLQDGVYLKDIEGSERPDIEAALFKNSRYSLMKSPHNWFVQAGYAFEQGTTNNPSFGEGLLKVKAEPFQNNTLKLNTGFGLGPYRSNDAEAYFGYIYFQDWNTDEDRLFGWLGDVTNITDFPFRPDLLQRTHLFYMEFEKKLYGPLYFALSGRFELARVGSQLFSTADNAEIKRVLNIENTSIFTPKLALVYGVHRTELYLYLRKELNDESPDLSNKSYNLLFNGSDQVWSYGLSQRSELKSFGTTLQLDLFRYESIYNDFWLDYTRDGFVGRIETEIVQGFFVRALAGAYQDLYPFPHIRLGSCKFGESIKSDTSIQACRRRDTGYLYQIGAAWQISAGEQLSAYYGAFSNSNPELKVFDEAKIEIVGVYTFAFPAVRRIEPFLNRFSDIAFRKDAN